MQTFHNGLNQTSRQMINIAAGGTLNNITPKQAIDMFESMALDSYQWNPVQTKLSRVAAFMMDLLGFSS